MLAKNSPTLSQTEPDASRLPAEVDYVKIGRELPQRFDSAPIHLIPPERLPTGGQLRKLFPDAARIFAVDFYVDGAEMGPVLPNGSGHAAGHKIVNIDHHSPHPRWERHISSGVLACRWVKKCGPVGPDDVIVINHVDCDSVIASLIVAGALPPLPRFEEAVLDADHRGRPNPISDLLQSFSTRRDLPGSVRVLSRELQGLSPEPEAAEELERLHSKRLEAKALARNAILSDNGVALIRSNRSIDSDLFLSALPDAVAIVIACPSKKYPDLELTRLRLGNASPPGVSLHRLGVSELDPYFGGRFNAGSNKRGLERARELGQTPQVINARKHFESLTKKLDPMSSRRERERS